jgi:hypothetical protein
MSIGQHIVLRLADHRVIAPDPAARRQVARSVLGIGRGQGLLSFRLADTHLHLLAACDRDEAGQLARRVEISLAQKLSLDVSFVPAYFKAVDDGRHLYRAFLYVPRIREFRRKSHQLRRLGARSAPLNEETG